MISHSYPSFNEKVASKAYTELKEGNFSARQISITAQRKLSSFSGGSYANLVSSGYSAVQCALVGVGVREGDDVLIPNIICPSVYHAIKSIGALPKLIDVDENVPLISMNSLRGQDRNSHVIIANMFGMRVKIDKSIKKFNKIIEDNAQLFSDSYSHWADATIYSFSPTKLLTVGYGGAVVTNEEKVNSKIEMFLDADHSKYPYVAEEITFRIHSSISDFQAAMLIEQLNRYSDIIKYRLDIQEIYDSIIGENRLKSDIPFRYQIILKEPVSNLLSERLQQRGINAMPLGAQLLSETLKIDGYFPNSLKWKNHILSLPIHERITNTQAREIALEVKSVL